MDFKKMLEDSPYGKLLPYPMVFKSDGEIDNTLPACVKLNVKHLNKQVLTMYLYGRVYDETYYILYYNHLFDDTKEPRVGMFSISNLDYMCDFLGLTYSIDSKFKPMLTNEILREHNKTKDKTPKSKKKGKEKK